MKPVWIAGLAFAVAAPCVARAQPAVDAFYKGKNFNVLIGSNVGGGYDAYARLVGRRIGKYIPGNPSVVFTNMPGAGGATVLNYATSVAPKDGTIVAATSGPALLDPMLGETRSVRGDPLQFKYIGSANAEKSTCVIRKDAPVQTFEDVFTKEAIIGSSGGTTHDLPAAMNAVLGTKLKLIEGYPGTRDVLLAMDKGEVQGLCGMGYTSVVTQRPDWLRADLPVRFLVQETLSSVPSLDKQGVPRSIDYAKTAEQRAVLEVVYAHLAFTRPFMMAPETPDDRVAAVREAFVASLNDPEVPAEAEKQGLEVTVMTGEELEQTIRKLYATPPDIVAKVRAAIATKERAN